MQGLYNPIYNSIYPHVAANRNFGIIKRFLLIGIPVVAVGVFLLIILAPFVMWVLGGSEYLTGSVVLQVLAPLLLFSYPAVLIGFPILAVINKEKLLTASSVAAAVFQIAGLFFLVAILRCLAEFIMLLFRAIFVFKSRKLLRAKPTSGQA